MKYLSVSEVAEKLGSHEKTVRRYIVNGDLQAKKVGGQWRIADTWLESFIKQDEPNEVAHHHSEHDFCVFMDSDYFESSASIQTCTIMDITSDDKELIALKAKGKACDILQRGERFKIEVRPHGVGLRLIMWGEPAMIQEVLEELK